MEHFNNGFNLIDKAHIETVKQRFLRISDAIEKSYYCDNFIKGEHSYFVGSYGRNTAINTSDIDIMVVLPDEVKKQFDGHNGNGESHLLQAIREAILKTYPNTKIRADGQVVVVEFTDGMKFEVLPGFKRGIDAYYHPDTHDGGSWKLTYPFLEQREMRKKNSQCNGLLYGACRYIRYIRDEYFKDMRLSGIVIDSFVFNSQPSYHWVYDKFTPISQRLYIEYLLYSCDELIRNKCNKLKLPGHSGTVPLRDSCYGLIEVLTYWINHTDK